MNEKKQELTPQYLLSLIKGNAEEIEAMKRKLTKHDRNFLDIEEEYPLLPPEADDLASAVKKKGVAVLGGKKSNAYQDRNLRTQVYRDIYSEIKRQYGLVDERGIQKSYKKLKRKYLTGAFAVIDTYEAPIAIANEIESLNEIDIDD